MDAEQSIMGLSTRLSVTSAGEESSYAAPQSPAGQNKNAAVEEATLPICRL